MGVFAFAVLQLLQMQQHALGTHRSSSHLAILLHAIGKYGVEWDSRGLDGFLQQVRPLGSSA